jgi:Major Facilitator Superfamily.
MKHMLMGKNPYKVYIFANFTSSFLFTFIFTVDLLYHVRMVALNPFQLVLVGTVLELTVFLFEIPTGMVADLKSRKLSIVIGYFLIGAGFLLEGLFPSFFAVLISQVLWGIGYTFTSGAVQAWIVDEIGESRAAGAFVNGAKAANLGNLLAIPFSILAGYRAVQLPIITGGLGMIGLAILLALKMTEINYRPRPRNEKESLFMQMKNNIISIFRQARASFLLRILLLISFLFGLYSEGFDRLWLSHLMERGKMEMLTESKLVLFTGTLKFIVVWATWFVLYRIGKSKRLREPKMIYGSLLTGSSLIIFSLFGFAFSDFFPGLLLWYILIQVCRQAMEPLTDIWLNNLIKDPSLRATFFSVKGQVDSIGQIGGGPIIGFIASTWSIPAALAASALFLSPVLLLYNLVLKKK